MNNKKSFIVLIAMLSTLLVLNGCAGAKGSTKAAKISNINKMRNEDMAELYRLEPGSRREISNAYGYAIFDNKGIYILALASGQGYGVAHNNKTGKDTYMKMYSAGAGVGMGVKTYTGVFVFANKTVYDYFLETGLTAQGSADMAAEYKDKGDSTSAELEVSPGVKLYQITDDGLALQATIQGAKFWKDDELN